MAMSWIGALFFILYVVVVAALAVLVVWALVLLIIFLRLRIAELRRLQAGADPAGSTDPAGTAGP